MASSGPIMTKHSTHLKTIDIFSILLSKQHAHRNTAVPFTPHITLTYNFITLYIRTSKKNVQYGSDHITHNRQVQITPATKKRSPSQLRCIQSAHSKRTNNMSGDEQKINSILLL